LPPFGAQDTGFKIQDSGYRIQDAEYRMQDAGCKIQDASWIGDTRFRIQKMCGFNEDGTFLNENVAWRAGYKRGKIHNSSVSPMDRNKLCILNLVSIHVSKLIF
jgi:hypothetical protein